MNIDNPNSGQEANILIVEDSATQAMLLQHLLESNGYKVSAAVSGKQALDLLSTERPALIISDIVMPEMDGYELTRAIKGDERLHDIPVILLTTLADPEDVLRGLEARVDYYLNKPIDEDYLLSKVRAVLSAPHIRGNGKDVQECHVTLAGKDHVIRLSAEDSLNLLVSTYENAVQINNKLLRTQLELRGLNHELERKVKERTAHLEEEIGQRKRAESSVRQRTVELETANVELKDFAYAVSHDLKAPLRAASQLAGWIAQDHAERLDDDGKEMLQLLLSRLDRMYNLIDGILQYSRIGKVKEEEVHVDLNALVPDIIDMLAPPPSIAVSIEGDLPVMTFERARIGQVFQNLISNAIKYMDKPNGLIGIRCQDEGESWKFSVSDNGPGIDPKYHEKIFQIFQTLSPRDEFESTGIGLTLVKKIVDLAGGRVWLESQEGKGATFLFTLPKQPLAK
jgi:signal transduction histidine kinase